jgi:hypothetical protein
MNENKTNSYRPLCYKLTVLVGNGSLKPQKAFIHVNARGISLPDKSKYEVVRKSGVSSLHLGKSGTERLRSRHIAMLELK